MDLYLVTTKKEQYYIVAESFDAAEKKLKNAIIEAFSPGYIDSDHYFVTGIKFVTEEAKDSRGKPYFYSNDKRLIL